VIIDASTGEQLFNVAAGAVITLKKLILLSGNGPTVRGIANHGNLTLDEVTMKEHPSLPAGNMILNVGPMTVKNFCQLRVF